VLDTARTTAAQSDIALVNYDENATGLQTLTVNTSPGTDHASLTATPAGAPGTFGVLTTVNAVDANDVIDLGIMPADLGLAAGLLPGVTAQSVGNLRGQIFVRGEEPNPSLIPFATNIEGNA